MKKSHILALCAAGLLSLGTVSTAQAQGLTLGFSNHGNYVGISSGPSYYPSYPTYVAPAPVYTQPYYPGYSTYYGPPAPVYYAPPRYYRPAPPRYYGPRGYYHGGHGHNRY